MPYSRLDILSQGRRQYRKKPTAVRVVSSELQNKLEDSLKLERSAILSEHPHMQILGLQYVCCDAVIQEICRRAAYVTTVDDLNSIPLLRTELRTRLYNVVTDVVGSAPPAKKLRQV